VITLMTDQQVRDVRALTRAAGITPTTTKVSGPGHAILRTLAPGERVLVAGGLGVAASDSERPGGTNRSGGRNRGRRTGGGGGGRNGGSAQKPAANAGGAGRSRRRRPAGAGGGSGAGHSASSFSRTR
jgi:hypothetical protein